jgi:hypothetical protein
LVCHNNRWHVGLHTPHTFLNTADGEKRHKCDDVHHKSKGKAKAQAIITATTIDNNTAMPSSVNCFEPGIAALARQAERVEIIALDIIEVATVLGRHL